MKFSLLISSLFSLLCYTSTSSAHDHEQLFNQVQIQAQSEREIPNDEMIVLLATEHEGSVTASLATKINSDMQWALEIIKQYPAIQSQTRSYQTYPTYRKQIIIGWRANQQVEIKSKDISALTELVGKMQEKLQVKQMSFNATKETRTNYENELIEEAMQAFLARVAIVKKYMPNKNHRIVNLNINTGGYRPPAIHAQRTMMKSMEMASAPAVEAGMSKLTVTVSGSVQYY